MNVKHWKTSSADKINVRLIGDARKWDFEEKCWNWRSMRSAGTGMGVFPLGTAFSRATWESADGRPLRTGPTFYHTSSLAYP